MAEEDKSPTEFLMRMLEGANMDGVTQVLVVKRWEGGEIGSESYGMESVDVLAAAKYLDISETINLRAALTGDEDD